MYEGTNSIVLQLLFTPTRSVEVPTYPKFILGDSTTIRVIVMYRTKRIHVNAHKKKEN